MKKAISVVMAFLTILATFSVLTLHAKALADYQLTTYPGADLWPSWSPDGTKIAYFAFAGSWYRNIWVMNNDGSNQVQLNSGSLVDSCPEFSPDGTKIAFERWGLRGDYQDLMIMDSDGSNIQRVTFGGVPGMIEGTCEEPQWSKDGTRLIFHYVEGTTAHGYSISICTINVDGSGLQVIARGANPRFCFDDTKILFGTDYFLDGQERIALMNADGSNVQILTSGPNDAYPDMSSLTHRIIFVRNQDLYIMNEDGSDLKPITSDGLNCYPRWSPDEKWIAYDSSKSGNWDIWKMEAPTVEAIEASVDIDPNSLSLKSKGKWITAYVELPEGYDVSDINVSTIMLNGTVRSELSPTAIGDYDNDGVPDLMIKFDRAAVVQYILDQVPIEERFMTVTLTITGKLNDGTPFQGSDTIKIILPVMGRQGIFPV
jgi:Tol biopolymer transport system component